MRASEMEREQVAAFVESDEGKSFMAEADKEWGRVMELARENGFVISAYGGTAVLGTYKAVMDELGTGGVVKMLQTSGIEIPDAAC